MSKSRTSPPSCLSDLLTNTTSAENLKTYSHERTSSPREAYDSACTIPLYTRHVQLVIRSWGSREDIASHVFLH